MKSETKKPAKAGYVEILPCIQARICHATPVTDCWLGYSIAWNACRPSGRRVSRISIHLPSSGRATLILWLASQSRAPLALRGAERACWMRIHRPLSSIAPTALFCCGPPSASHAGTRWLSASSTPSQMRSRPAARQVSFEHSAGMPKRKAHFRGLWCPAINRT